ncbi:MAG: class I SAM-dependent rRNA methyltransferase [Fimbriimonadaceae bacterium]|nr:class I SAM-dependent rRNA methyltransferase [Fimbriimonadaceae bacterium]QYK57722.1 MAG: class I SAM-dependent rRNA methyltransferase [Fimbriimonadaceae bacterium]
MLHEVRLKRGKERKITRFYPWAQKGECQAEGLEDGQTARLVDADGKFLATGTWNSQSRFQFRVFSLTEEPLDEAFFLRRFQTAVSRRQALGFQGKDGPLASTDACRIVSSEADQVPGLVVDQYGPFLIVQVRSLGMERLRDQWLGPLIEATGCQGVMERSEMAGREEEGLGPRAGLMYGEVPEETEITENGVRHVVPLVHGLKTGFYLDQRETRRQFSARVRPGDKVLDAFCYTGAFSLAAANQGALAYGVDRHTLAIETARRSAALNKLEAVFVEANAFDYLVQDALGPYDWIVLDPPAIAKTAEKRDSLKWAVWRLVHDALPLLRPGGTMIVCACTYQLSVHETIETCRLAAGDRGVRIDLDRVTLQDLDHPAPVWFPEALYLKCVWITRT